MHTEGKGSEAFAETIGSLGIVSVFDGAGCPHAGSNNSANVLPPHVGGDGAVMQQQGILFGLVIVSIGQEQRGAARSTIAQPQQLRRGIGGGSCVQQGENTGVRQLIDAMVAERHAGSFHSRALLV